jgi:nucleoside-diphosphate-sugar epimerase
LADRGFEVTALLRPSSDASRVVGLTIARDTGRIAELAALLERRKTDAVVHLAGCFVSEHGPDDVEPLVEANVALGTRLLEAMRLAGVSRLVDTGTAWQHYHSDGYRPVNLYAATKQAFGDILQYYVDLGTVRAVTLDLFDTYGPGDWRPKLVPALLAALRSGRELAMSSGDQSLDLVHVEDVCQAYEVATRRLLAGDPARHATYSVSTGAPRTLREVVRTLEQAAGATLSVAWGARPDRAREVKTPWRGGERLPGWAAQVALEDGFARLVRDA